MGPIGTTLGSKQHICCKTVSLVLVITANRTVKVLILWGVEIRNIHNFDETWMIVSRSCIVSKRIKISSNFFSPSDSHTILFRTKRDGNTQTGTPLMGASNAGGVG